MRPTAILGPDGNPVRTVAPAPPARVRPVRARYDAALSTDDNARAWSLVDSMSARAANSKEVRSRLRLRSRYEVGSNSYVRGIINTLANDTVGTGPRLQLHGEDDAANDAIEGSFACWARCVHLADKLRTMRMALCQDGEAFALFINNDKINHPVQLDLTLIEADQVSTPFLNPIDPLEVDGIRYDLAGNPVLYSLLRRHPGDTYQVGLLADLIPAASVIHWFRKDRPGQLRGIPELTPALELFNQLRRYTLAVLAAAETAADHAAVLYSELPPDVEAENPGLLCLDIEKRSMVTLPMGWKMSQFRAEQPATTYEMFKAELIKEVCRCLNMPYNVASGDSSNYNYASGRLDHQTYHKAIRVDRSNIELVILDRVFRAWVEEAWLATDLIPGGTDPLEGWPRVWHWDGFEHVDPEKEAKAQQIRLQNNTTTLADEYARQGQDYEIKVRQRAKEYQLCVSLGLPPYGPLPPPPMVPAAAQDEAGVTSPEGGEDESDDTEGGE